MSYARWGLEGSDVYVYASERYDPDVRRVVQQWVCCGCLLEEDAAPTPSHALPNDHVVTSLGALHNHLIAHRDAGHVVPQSALDRIADELEKGT